MGYEISEQPDFGREQGSDYEVEEVINFKVEIVGGTSGYYINQRVNGRWTTHHFDDWDNLINKLDQLKAEQDD